MLFEPFRQLFDFVEESNRIEGIVRKPKRGEIAAHKRFLNHGSLNVQHLCQFTLAIEPLGYLRLRAGMNVIVGGHQPIPGGPDVAMELDRLLQLVNQRRVSPFQAHCAYEHLHPFMDGNGRSGRALWLWMHGGIEKVPLGFLHTFYYESLNQFRPAAKVEVTNEMIEAALLRAAR